MMQTSNPESLETVSTFEGHYRGRDGVEIFRREWRPTGTPRATLVLVHGMSEHSGRYDPLGRFLAQNGVAVHALDHRGHGRSGGEVGTVEEFGYFLDDLETFVRLVRGENTAGPLVMLGHSMGGLIVAAYLLERSAQPDLVVLSGPAIVPILEPGGRQIDPTRLTRDPAEQKAYMEDPLILRERVKEDLFYRLAEGVGLLVGRAGEVKQPLLLIHGVDDRLCSAEGARMWVEGVSSKDITVQLYPEGRHEMFNETNREDVIAALWGWLDARLPKAR